MNLIHLNDRIIVIAILMTISFCPALRGAFFFFEMEKLQTRNTHKDGCSHLKISDDFCFLKNI